MAQSTQLIDGRFDLAQQEDQLNFCETVAFREVLAYVKHSSEGKPANRAIFDDVAFDVEHKDLELVVIGEADNPAQIIAEKIADGKNVIFHTRVFVEGADTVVIAFR